MSFIRNQRRRLTIEQEQAQQSVPLEILQRRRPPRNAPLQNRIQTRGSTIEGRLRYLREHDQVEVETLRLNAESQRTQAMDYFFPGSTEVRFRTDSHSRSSAEFPQHVLQVSFRSFEHYFERMRGPMMRALQVAFLQMNAFRVGLHMEIEAIELNELLMMDDPPTISGVLSTNSAHPRIPPVEGEFHIGEVLETMIQHVRSELERMMYQHSQLIFHQVIRMRISCASMGLQDARTLVNRRVVAGRGDPVELQEGWQEMNMPIMLRKCLMDVYHESQEDNVCFYYALWYGMLRQLTPSSIWTSHEYARISSFYFREMNMMFPVLEALQKIPFESDITYPVHPNDLYRIDARLNRLGFAINAYHYQGNEEVIGTLYTSRKAHTEGIKHVDLLLINANLDTDAEINHWMLIKDFPLFLSANHMFGTAYTSMKGKKAAMLRFCAKGLENDWVCRICVKKCKSNEEYETHTRLCSLDRVGGKGCTEVYRTPEKAIFYFDDYHKLFMDPFVVYADFECLVQKAKHTEERMTDNTIQDQLHIPISCGFRIGTFNDHYRSWIPEDYRRIFMIMNRYVHLDKYKVGGKEKETKKTMVALEFIQHMITLKEHLQVQLQDGTMWKTPCTILEYCRRFPAKSTHCCFCRIELGIQEIQHPMYTDEDAFDRGPCVAFQPFAKPEMEDERLLGLAHRLCYWKFLGKPYNHAGKFGDNEKASRKAHNERIQKNPELFNDADEIEAMEEIFAALVARVASRYYKENFTLKIFFHNLTGYDGHLLIQAIEAHHQDISCIPQSGDKFLSIKFSGLHFLDSYKFLKGSLDDLARTTIMAKMIGDRLVFDSNSERLRCIGKMKDALDCIGERFHVEMTDEHINLLLRKGVFPYEYFSEPEVLDETQLPGREKFDSLLYGSSISEAEYSHAQKVWDAFKMTCFGDYHDLYLLVDVMLLHLIFENFRWNEYKKYGFDVSQFFSLPGYAYSQCLYLADAWKPNSIFTLDLINNQQSEMAKQFEGMKRGGISCIMKRFTNVSTKTNEEIKMFDANNLYGYAMEQPLPVGNYRYLSPTEIEQFIHNNVLKTYNYKESRKGYILEVDLHLPVSLYEKFKHYPMFPIKRPILYDETSPYYKSEIPRNRHDEKTPKLVLDLHDRSFYSTHIALLQLGLEEGYELKKIHRILEFEQIPWMQSHIRRQTQDRQKATTDIGKDIPKLISNSTFGKTIEDSRKHQTVKIITEENQFETMVRSAKYSTHRIVNEGIVVVHQRKTRIDMNRPIMVGIIILELSKLLMYTFYYQVLYKTFGPRLQLLMTDTDSLAIHVRDLKPGKGIIDELHEYHDQWFDLSNYPPSYDYSTSNKKVVGKMKDEFISEKPGEEAQIKRCTEFVGCKAKMASFEFEDFAPKMIAKGITKAVLKKQIHHSTYRKVLLGDEEHNTSVPAMTMHTIRSENNRIYTYSMEKSTLDAMDDKIYLLDRVNCVPYGYVQK